MTVLENVHKSTLYLELILTSLFLYAAICNRAKIDGVKFGRTLGSKNPKTAEKIEKIEIFLKAGKSYDWITKELSVSNKTISDIRKSILSKAISEKSEIPC